MNENKFLKNLSGQSSQIQAVEPTPPQPIPQRRTGQSDSMPTDYDPIKRLTDELSRQSRAIEGLNTRIDRMEQRPKATTQAELQALLHEAREGVNFTIDSKQIAGFVLPELTKGLPTPAGIKAAVDAGARTITAAGTSAAERIERAGSGAASRIEWASRSKADTFAGQVGFTSWKAAAVVFGAFVGLSVLASLQNEQRAAETLKAQAETQAVREFTDWIKTQPQGRKLYDRYYNYRP